MLGSWKKKLILLGGVTLIAAGGWAAQALAETPTPAATAVPGREQRTNYREVLAAKLAAALGIDQEKLKGSLKQAAKDTVDEAVKNGDLGANQAEKLKSRIDQQGVGAALGAFGHGKHGRGQAPGPVAKGSMLGVILQASADKLGMGTADLGAQLKSGKSVADVAASKGVSVEDLRGAVVTAAKAKLDNAVKAGNLTQEREDAILQQLRQGDWPTRHLIIKAGNRKSI